MFEESIILDFNNKEQLLELYGTSEENFRAIEAKFNIRIHARTSNLRLIGDKESVEKAALLISTLVGYSRHSVKDLEVKSFINLFPNYNIPFENFKDKHFIIKTKKKSITPHNQTQLEYINLIYEKEIILASGPAGTGKTYLAVALGVDFFLTRKVDKIILSRSAVEAGEKIGFLPGSIEEKIDPYLRPLYDALYDMMDSETLNRNIEEGKIEIAPLAFMRGRTFNNAYIILDEAQNTTITQMKMFLTRLGRNSHMVISGDPLQTDLPKTVFSGMADGINRLSSIKEIGIVKFSEKDIIRNKLISKILKAYEH